MQAIECSGADEEDIIRLHVERLTLLHALTATLLPAGDGITTRRRIALLGASAGVRWTGSSLGFGLHRDRRTFDDFEESLLDPFAANISTHSSAYFTACELVQFIEADDPAFGGFDVVVCGCQEALDADFGVFANVAGLREGGAVAHAEGHVQYSSERLGHESLSNTARPEE